MNDEVELDLSGTEVFEALSLMLAPFLALFAVWSVIGLGLIIWYLWAMARLFPRIGLPAGQGWIPLWNEWRLISRTGLPGWTVIFYLLPLVNVVPLIMRTMAQYRIGREAGVSGGYTVLGFFIAPLWATLIGSRLRGRVLPDPTKPSATLYQPGATGGGGAGYGAPGAPGAYGAAAAAVHGGSAPMPPPAAAPVPPPAADPWASPSWGPGSLTESRPAGSVGPLGVETEVEYERLAAQPFEAPPAVPLGGPAQREPFSWTAASQAAPEPEPQPEIVPPPVHPLAGIPAPPVMPPAPAAPAAPAAPVPPAPTAPAPVAAAPAAPPAPVPAVPIPAVAATPAHAADDDLDRTVVVRRNRVMWSLVLPDGSLLELAPDTIVGRRPEASEPYVDAQTLAIPDPTRTLSKTHARFRLVSDAWVVEDLHSTNGVVLLNPDGTERELVPGQPAPAGDRLLLGTLEVRLRRDDVTA